MIAYRVFTWFLLGLYRFLLAVRFGLEWLDPNDLVPQWIVCLNYFQIQLLIADGFIDIHGLISKDDPQ